MAIMGELISGQDLPIQPPQDIEAVCHFVGGVLYVASSSVMDPKVLAFEAKLQRLQLLTRKEQVSLDHLNELKRSQNERQIRLTAAEELRHALAFLEIGVRMKASDLHFVLEDSICHVRYRVDGFLDTYTDIPATLAERYISALYVASDVKSRGGFSFNTPIAARIRSGLPAGLYAVRFASMKTDRGGMVVLRLLYDTVANRAYTKVDLPTLGFNEEQVRALQAMAEAPNGLIVIDGPTGSGKSTTLKYVLQWVRENYPAFNIITARTRPSTRLWARSRCRWWRKRVTRTTQRRAPTPMRRLSRQRCGWTPT
jgi:type II secretory ATPase GspE/PulE/Tfp pilus assembly ATPase PilB-like protein